MSMTVPLRISPALLRQASYGTIKIGTYNSLKRLFVSRPEGERWLLLCASVSFCVCMSDPTGSVWCSPLQQSLVCLYWKQPVSERALSLSGSSSKPSFATLCCIFIHFLCLRRSRRGTCWYFKQTHVSQPASQPFGSLSFPYCVNDHPLLIWHHPLFFRYMQKRSVLETSPLWCPGSIGRSRKLSAGN